MPTNDKMYPDTKPVKNPYDSDWVREKMEEFLRGGGKITNVPRGVHAEEAQPLSTVRRNLEKIKNFGDKPKTPR